MHIKLRGYVCECPFKAYRHSISTGRGQHSERATKRILCSRERDSGRRDDKGTTACAFRIPDWKLGIHCIFLQTEYCMRGNVAVWFGIQYNMHANASVSEYGGISCLLELYSHATNSVAQGETPI